MIKNLVTGGAGFLGSNIVNELLNSGKEENAKEIFSKWGLDFSIIGKTTNTKNLVLNFNGEKVADLPLNSLSKDAPVYNRKWKKNLDSKKINPPKNYQSKKLIGY